MSLLEKAQREGAIGRGERRDRENRHFLGHISACPRQSSGISVVRVNTGDLACPRVLSVDGHKLLFFPYPEEVRGRTLLRGRRLCGVRSRRAHTLLPTTRLQCALSLVCVVCTVCGLVLLSLLPSLSASNSVFSTECVLYRMCSLH